MQETRKTIHKYFPVKLLDWVSVLHLSLSLPTDFLGLLSATWYTKLLDIDDNWKEHTKYLEKESLEAGFGDMHLPHLIEIEVKNRQAGRVTSIYPWYQALGRN